MTEHFYENHSKIRQDKLCPIKISFVKNHFDYFCNWHENIEILLITGGEGAIHQKLFAFLPEFEIVIGGRTVGTIRKEFSFFTPKYHVDFRGWDVEGDMLHWNYEVCDRDRTIMYISKEILNWGDTYTLSYDDVGDEISGLLLVIAIDAANCDHND